MNQQKWPHLPVQSILHCLSIALILCESKHHLTVPETNGDVKQVNIRNIICTTFG